MMICYASPGAINVYDKEDNDTLWARVFYNEFERNEIDLNLKKSIRYCTQMVIPIY